MRINEAHANLTKVLLNGRIILNNLPLTLMELDGLMQSEKFLYDKAQECVEAQQEPIQKTAEVE